MDGLEQACEIFRSRFKITARGISRSYWAEDAEHPTKVGQYFQWLFGHLIARGESIIMHIFLQQDRW